MKRLLKGLTFILIFLITTFCPANDIYATEGDELDIEAFPDSELFNITNMVPGDWGERKLTILNVGEKNFTYRTEVDLISGSENLYNQFLVQVWDANGAIFRGKLHELEELEPRHLKASHQEDLKFVVEFPEELGNEYQGLDFIFELKFLIEDQNDPGDPNEPGEPTNPGNPGDSEDPGNPTNPDGAEPPDEETTVQPQHPIDPEDLGSTPVEGTILPSTATNTFQYIIAGIFLSSVGAISLIIQRRRKSKDIHE
jgi:LPXTG-motif cell wall-anchored protein